jgi:hypothetical protein
MASYSIDNGYLTTKLCCFLCLVYSSKNSTFCSGFDEWKHVHIRLEQHETSKAHDASTRLFIAAKMKKSTQDLLFDKQITKGEKR